MEDNNKCRGMRGLLLTRVSTEEQKKNYSHDEQERKIRQLLIEPLGILTTAALFGAFLGYNPIGELIPAPVLQAISPTHQAILLGKTFFPNLIATPFMQNLHAVFYISAALCLIGATASLLRGKRVVYGQEQR